jgi:hypothetical protein
VIRPLRRAARLAPALFWLLIPLLVMAMATRADAP